MAYDPTGYDTGITWRYTLPGVVSYGITPFHFEINTNNMLFSYHADFVSISIIGGILNFSPISDISIISFTIIVITEDLPYLELINFMDGAPTFSGVNPNYVYSSTSTSSKFSFDGSSTYSLRCFWHWVSVNNPSLPQMKLNLACS